MRMLWVWFVRLLAVGTFITHLVAIFVDHGLGWVILGIVFFPVTFVVAPISVLVNEPTDVLPLALTVLLLVSWLITIFSTSRQEEGNARRFRDLCPLLDDALYMLSDAPVSYEGEVQPPIRLRRCKIGHPCAPAGLSMCATKQRVTP